MHRVSLGDPLLRGLFTVTEIPQITNISSGAGRTARITSSADPTAWSLTSARFEDHAAESWS